MANVETSSVVPSLPPLKSIRDRASTDATLAALLTLHREEIAIRWAAQIRATVHASPTDRPVLDIHTCCRQGLSALIDRLESGSLPALDGFVQAFVLSTIRAGANIGQAVGQAMVFLNTALPFVLDHGATGARDVDRATLVLRLVECVEEVVAQLCPSFAIAKGGLLREETIREERCRFARELHDSWAQSIYGMSLLAETAERYLAEENRDAVAGRLAQIRQLTQAMLAEIRTLIFRLRPPDLARIGLGGAIRSRLDLVGAGSGLKTSLAVVGDHPPPLEMEEAFLGIANELLNNTIRHARATHVSVALRQSPQDLVLEVADDGVGFDLALARKGTGLGLGSMHERARAIGARLIIETSPGRGTRARVSVSARAAVDAVAKDACSYGLTTDSHPCC